MIRTASILDEIVAHTRNRLPEAKEREPQEALEQRIEETPPARDFAGALRTGRIAVIAEVKRASPSAGLLKKRLNPVRLASTYASAGASAISVLTEPKYFRGALGDLLSVRVANIAVPLLRKDFVVDPYQVYQARAYGADALLLIVAVLADTKLADLLGHTRRLGMEALVEVHDEMEADRAVRAGAKVIGINNRDLRDFSVDLTTTQRLRALIPKDRVVVSESGIKGPADIARLWQWGVDAVLVGESLVIAQSPADKLRELFDVQYLEQPEIQPTAAASAATKGGGV